LPGAKDKWTGINSNPPLPLPGGDFEERKLLSVPDSQNIENALYVKEDEISIQGIKDIPSENHKLYICNSFVTG
jgi:hypothetical protein